MKISKKPTPCARCKKLEALLVTLSAQLLASITLEAIQSERADRAMDLARRAVTIAEKIKAKIPKKQ